ncbi:MAG: DNA polymerase III subunit alpha [Planctomycetes bacterium]|nr:DNA polymerase III subunit alpha [Planctomycetota bacterium]
MVAPAFVHTHVHSHYSLLDGAAQVADLVAAAARYEQPALALTDHGNLCGAVEFYKACKAKGVKPILGLEAYLAPKSRFDRTKNPVVAHHLILLAMNETGYRNLIKLSSRSFTEGFYYVPRVDKELLAAHHEGIIAQSACLSGEPSYYVRNGDLARAAQGAGEMKAIFGDRYYLELQRNGCDGQEEVNQGLVRIAREQRIPLVATNDVHYVAEDDRLAHEVHMCIGMGKTLKDANRLKQEALVCFKPSEPMYGLFADVEEAPRSTLDIAARCDLSLDLGKFHLPKFTPPEGQEPVAYFRRLCREGAQRRYGAPLPAAVEARLAEETSVIEQMGFVSYFLIVWDFIRWAKEQRIPVGPGRGSAAGSLVAFSLGITNVDPLAHDLLFERFLNRERISMPDIDIDFCKDGREEVIHYVQEKYGGRERVSQIVTFGTMAARAVIRDVGRVLDVPLKDVDALAKKVPNGPNADLGKALETDPDLKAEVEKDPRFQELVRIAKRLEGLNRNASKHAAGVVIADAPLEEYVPLYKVGDDVTTQFTMDVLEEIGLLKMDFLGLRTLTILAKAVENVRRAGRTPPDLDALPPDDADTYRMLARGEALGVFQLESSGMRDLLARIKPDRFADLSAIVALFRPGPLGSGMVDQYVERKHGRQAITYLHPTLEPILKETLGVIVYQEQVMRIANVLAGFSLNEADTLRKAMGKKKPEVMAKYREKFVQGCAKRSIPEATANEIWSQIEFFAGYGFNKSHTVAYAIVTFHTAWMKCHEPLPFMAALLTCESGDRDKLAEYIDECRRMGIRVLPPDVSRSEHDFTVEGDAIRYGLGSVKGVGEAAARAIVLERERGGPFASVYDLCERVDAKTMNKATLEALTHGGAFDASKARRAQVLAVLDRAMKLASEAHADRSAGQTNLFGGGDAEQDAAGSYPDVPEIPMADLLAAEKDALGYYVTSHPLADHEALLRRHTNKTSATVKDAQEKEKVVLGGLITGFRTSVIKQGPNEGKKMAFFRLEDFAGSASCVAFSRAFAEHASRLGNDRVVLVEGDVDTSREEPTVRVNRVITAEEAPVVLARGVLVRLADVSPSTIEAVRKTLQAHTGPLPVALEVHPDPRSKVVVKAAPSWSVTASQRLIAELRAIVGVRGAELLASDL